MTLDKLINLCVILICVFVILLMEEESKWEVIVTIHKLSVGALEYVKPSSMIATTIITTLKQDNCESFRNLAKITQLGIPSGGLCSWNF